VSNRRDYPPKHGRGDAIAGVIVLIVFALLLVAIFR